MCLSNLQAQSRYDNVGYEFDWFTANIREVSLGIEVEAEIEDSRLERSTTSYHRHYVYVAPTLGLELEGSVYHPNLLYYDLKTEDGVSWQQQYINVPTGLSPAGKESKTQFLGRYDAQVALLNEKPYATILTAARDHNFRQYDFFNRATVDSESYGVRSGYAAGPIPFTVAFRDWSEDVSSSTRPSHLDETTLLFDARNERARWNAKTSFTYSFDDYTRRELGFQPDEGTFHNLNLIDIENFGDREQVKLNSSVLYRSQESPSGDSQSLDLDERLRAEHTERLHSDYTYRFNDRWLDSNNTMGQGGQVALSHRLYENLDSSVEVHVDTQNSSSGSDSSLDVTRYGVGWNESYTRRLSTWGRLTIGTGLNYDQEDRESTGQTIYIIQEPHTLTDGVVTYLNQPNVIGSSVRVTDPNGREYQLLLDYVLIPRGQLMEIRRASGATQIPNGGAILVDYQASIPPSDDFSTLGTQFSIRLDLLRDMVGLYARFNRVNNHGGESLVLQDVFDQIFGLDFSWRWLRTGAEYEIYDSNLAPFNAARFFQTLTFDLKERSSLSFDFAQTWTTFPDTDTERKTADAIVRFRTQLTPHLAWDNQGGVRLDRGSGFDQTLFVARTGLEYSRGQLTYRLGYEYQHQDYLSDNRDKHFFFLRARRRF